MNRGGVPDRASTRLFVWGEEIPPQEGPSGSGSTGGVCLFGGE